MIPLAFVAVFGIVWFLNKVTRSQPDAVVVRKQRRTISLPAYGVEFDANEIKEFVEVTGSYTHAGETSLWKKELSLLVERDGIHFRFPIKTDLSNLKIRNRVRKLGEELGVPYRILDQKAKGSYEHRLDPPNYRYDGCFGA